MTRALFKLSLTTAAVTVLLTASAQYYVQQERLREAARLRAENDRLHRRIIQQTQTRLEKSGVTRPPTEVAAMSDQSRPVKSETGRLKTPTAEVSFIPLTEYRDEGQATPIAAFQTYAWACDHGDTARMIRLIRFDEAAQQKAVAYVTLLKTRVQTQWDSPEAMAADLLIDEGIQTPYPSAAIMALAKIEVISENRVALLLPGTSRERTEFQKTVEGWKYAITEKMVDDYIAENKIMD